MNEINVLKKSQTEVEIVLRNKLIEFQSFLDFTDLIFIALNKDGNVILANKKCCEVMEYNRENILGKNWFENFIPEGKKEIYDLDFNLAEYSENSIKTKSGNEKVILWHNKILKNQNGEIIGHLCSGSDITEQRSITFNLKERMKEISCLYEISEIIENNINISDILQKCVNILPSAWQYPDNTCARINYNEIEVKTPNFKKSKWKQSSDIIINKRKVGNIEIFYQKLKPIVFEGPFLKEERDFIDNVASRLANTIKNKEAEEMLKESEKKSRNILETVPYGVQVSDTEGKITYSNIAHHKIQGCSFGDIEGKYIWDFVSSEEERNKTREYYKEIIKNPIKPVVYYNKDETNDGRTIDTQINWNYIRDNNGFITGICSVISDITEQKRKEGEIKATKAKLQHLLDSSPTITYTFLIKKNEREISFISENVKKILGYEGKELFNLHYWESFIHPDDIEYVNSDLSILIKEGNHTNEYRFMNKEGEYRWLRDSKRIINNSDKNSVEFIGTLVDITERKTIEIELASINRVLHIHKNCSETIISAINESDLLNEICYIIKEVGEYNSAWIGMKGSEKNAVYIVASEGLDKDLLSSLNTELIKKDSECQHIINSVISNGKIEINKCMNNQNKNEFHRSIVQEKEIKTTICIPIATLEKTFGIINIYSKNKELPSSNEIDLFNELSNNIAMRISSLRVGKPKKAINNSNLHSDSDITSLDSSFWENKVKLGKLDDIDKQIIDMLSENGRMKLVNVSSNLSSIENQKLSDVGVSKRLSKMIKNKNIKIQANVNLKSLGTVFALLMLETKNYSAAKIIINKYKNCPQVLFSYSTSEKYNLIYGIYAANLDLLDAFINGCSPKIQPNVVNSKILISTKHFQPEFLPVSQLFPNNVNNKECGFKCQSCEVFKHNECPGCLQRMV